MSGSIVEFEPPSPPDKRRRSVVASMSCPPIRSGKSESKLVLLSVESPPNPPRRVINVRGFMSPNPPAPPVPPPRRRGRSRLSNPELESPPSPPVSKSNVVKSIPPVFPASEE